MKINNSKWLEARPRYKVADNAYNRANYPTLIGKEYYNPPSYVAVHVLDKAGNVVK